jgi:hypothetical protein
MRRAVHSAAAFAYIKPCVSIAEVTKPHADSTHLPGTASAQCYKVAFLLHSSSCAACAQEEDVLSDNNVFLEPYGVPQLVRRVLQRANIVLPPRVVQLAAPYGVPGTYRVPLALLDAAGEQVALSVQLVPRQASAEQLRAFERAGGKLRPAPSDAGDS